MEMSATGTVEHGVQEELGEVDHPPEHSVTGTKEGRILSWSLFLTLSTERYSIRPQFSHFDKRTKTKN